VKADQRKGFKRFESTLFTIFMVIGIITLIRFLMFG